jgi:hypothetical protein
MPSIICDGAQVPKKVWTKVAVASLNVTGSADAPLADSMTTAPEQSANSLGAIDMVGLPEVRTNHQRRKIEGRI